MIATDAAFLDRLDNASIRLRKLLVITSDPNQREAFDRANHVVIEVKDVVAQCPEFSGEALFEAFDTLLGIVESYLGIPDASS